MSAVSGNCRVAPVAQLVLAADVARCVAASRVRYHSVAGHAAEAQGRWASRLLMEDTAYIRVTRHPYEEPYHLDLVWDVSDGSQRASIEVYLSASDLITLADGA